jgi:hypothetical protein
MNNIMQGEDTIASKEKNMEFNTQICTNKEQSKRLIDLGLNPNTSDMHHYRWSEGYWDIQNCPPRGSNSNFIPAWSLHRLIAMLPNELEWLSVMLSRTSSYPSVIYKDKNLYAYTERWRHVFNDKDNIYDNIIDSIEWLIKENYFNKEYLKNEE